jgi:RNA polymerase sigma-70 factor (ECF subfamily)
MHPEPSHHDEFLRNFLGNHDSLAGFLRSLLFSDEEVREVMQDVAAVLWRKFTPGMEAEAFRRWAFGTARLEALAFRRTRARDRHVFGEQVFALLEESAVEAPQTVAPRREALRRCLEKLPATQRELVTAAYTPGTRIDELAASLGRTAMAVYKTLHRIRLALSECVGRTLASEELV